jgi:hypothetical protein
MEWSGRDVALAMVAGGGGGVLAALVRDWAVGIPLWQPDLLGVCFAVGACIGLLCTRFVRPSDP